MVAEYARPIFDEIDGLRGFDKRSPTWRLPGCDERCSQERFAALGTLAPTEIVRHDPAAHEAYGRASANLAIRTDGLVCRTGGLVIDHAALAVTLHGRAIHCTRRELQILLYLSARIGRACTYADLAKAIWDEDAPWKGAHTLRVNMARLRAKLGAWGHLIVTIPGVGYRLLQVEPRSEP